MLLNHKNIFRLIRLIEIIQDLFNNYSKHEKLIDTIDNNEYEILSDTGFVSITNIHKTKKFNPFYIKLKNNSSLVCADKHIFFDSEMNQIFAKHLKRHVSRLIVRDTEKFTGTKLSYVDNKIEYNVPVHMYDITVDSLYQRYYTNDILSHNTTTTAAFIAWYLCFHADRNIAVLANKQKTAIEIVDKVTQIIRHLPFFLKPGIIGIGNMGMSLDNGCQLMCQATTKTAQIGFTIHVLYMDEFAHVQPNIANSFWRSVYPTLSSSLISQCIVTSTPNGMGNKFSDIWFGAINNENSFKPFRVDWWQVPGHDEEWAKQQRKDFGSEEFDQEFGLQFNVSAKLLIHSSIMKFLNRIEQRYEYKELDKSKMEPGLIQNLYWDPSFDPNQTFTENDLFLLSIDLSGGQESEETKFPDFNTISIFKVEPVSTSKLRNTHPNNYNIKNFFRLRQVGLYHDNVNIEDNTSSVAKDLVFNILGEENCKVLVEVNFNGSNFINKFSDHDNFFDGIMVRTHHSKPLPGENVQKKIGYRTKSDKEYFLKKGVEMLENRNLIINDSISLMEFSNFGRDNKGKIRGLSCKDDTCMANLNVSRFYEDEEYEVWLTDLFDRISETEPNKWTNMVNAFLQANESKNDLSDNAFNTLYGLPVFNSF